MTRVLRPGMQGGVLLVEQVLGKQLPPTIIPVWAKETTPG